MKKFLKAVVLLLVLGACVKLAARLFDRNEAAQLYAVVLDQHGKPVAGAEIKMRVRHWLPLPWPDGRSIEVVKETDAAGRFELHKVRGDVNYLAEVNKAGYSLSQKTGRGLGMVAGTSEQPVEIKMWKSGPKEPLVKGEKRFSLIPDGRVYSLDLLQGKKLDHETLPADIRISITRPEKVEPREKYEWSFTLEAIDGGLIETSDEFMYLAPETGYEPKYHVEFSPDEPRWSSLLKRRFFLRTRDGQVYGSMEIEVLSQYQDKSMIELNYRMNPAGSRNLEP